MGRRDGWISVVGMGVGALAVAAVASGVVVVPLFAGRWVPQTVAAWVQRSHRPLVFVLGVVAYGLPWWGLRRVHGHAARNRDLALRRRDGAILWTAAALVTLFLAAPAYLASF